MPPARPPAPPRAPPQELLGKFIGEPVGEWEGEWEKLEGAWARVQWIWNRPQVERIRITLTLANFSVRVPALIALFLTQISLVASTISLPMLAPLVLGAGIALKSIVSNARTVLPRAGLILTFLWVIWFTAVTLQNTVSLLYRQGAVDNRLANAMHTLVELAAIVAGLMVVLTLVGVNVSGLLLPAFVAAAFCCKDVFINFVSGFFLFVVQPFKAGDTVAVPFSTPTASSLVLKGPAAAGQGAPKGGWFEGVCDSVDLRYTVLRNGQRRLYMPNSMFLSREFMVTDMQNTWSRKADALSRGKGGTAPRGDAYGGGADAEWPLHDPGVSASPASYPYSYGGARPAVYGPPAPHGVPAGHAGGSGGVMAGDGREAGARGWPQSWGWGPAWSGGAVLSDAGGGVAPVHGGVPIAPQYDPNIAWRAMYGPAVGGPPMGAPHGGPAAGAGGRGGDGAGGGAPGGSGGAGPGSSDAGPGSSDAGPGSSDAGPGSSDAGPSGDHRGVEVTGAGPAPRPQEESSEV